MEISIIGGDLRTVKLIKLLAQDKNKIKKRGDLKIVRSCWILKKKE